VRSGCRASRRLIRKRNGIGGIGRKRDRVLDREGVDLDYSHDRDQYADNLAKFARVAPEKYLGGGGSGSSQVKNVSLFTAGLRRERGRVLSDWSRETGSIWKRR